MTEQKFCKTCALWDQFGSTFAPLGRCMSPKLAEQAGQDDVTDMLLYEYSEGGEFHTGPDFGCVHHAGAS